MKPSMSGKGINNKKKGNSPILKLPKITISQIPHQVSNLPAVKEKSNQYKLPKFNDQKNIRIIQLREKSTYDYEFKDKVLKQRAILRNRRRSDLKNNDKEDQKKYSFESNSKGIHKDRSVKIMRSSTEKKIEKYLKNSVWKKEQNLPPNNEDGLFNKIQNLLMQPSKEQLTKAGGNLQMKLKKKLKILAEKYHENMPKRNNRSSTSSVVGEEWKRAQISRNSFHIKKSDFQTELQIIKNLTEKNEKDIGDYLQIEIAKQNIIKKKNSKKR